MTLFFPSMCFLPFLLLPFIYPTFLPFIFLSTSFPFYVSLSYICHSYVPSPFPSPLFPFPSPSIFPSLSSFSSPLFSFLPIPTIVLFCFFPFMLIYLPFRYTSVSTYGLCESNDRCQSTKGIHNNLCPTHPRYQLGTAQSSAFLPDMNRKDLVHRSWC